MAIVIESRFRGPADSGNGGYSAGVIARELGGESVEVTLRLPPPLDEPLRLDAQGRVWDDHALVAEAVHAEVGIAPADPVAWGDALAAEAPDLESPFPECFVCGHARGVDGLHLHAGAVDQRGVHAATWTVRADTVGLEFVWAVLDCPGAYATGMAGRNTVVLGRLTARVDRVPEPEERCVVVAWPLGSEGRKHAAGTALFTDAGELLGLARALWIEPRL
ncbi:MAG: hypothetical protein H0X39_14500 [Actinobacteria bacterium]|nr:hypothetical protein [Actinomycetota bacterium]